MAKKMSIHSILVFLLAFASGAAASTIDPFTYFNVYSLNDIGQPDDLYNTDIQGTTGAGGNTYLGMAIGTEQINEYGLHTGGNVYIREGSAHGKLDIGGSAEIYNFAVNVDAYAGGDVFLATSTSGAGTVNAGGVVTKENPWSTIPVNNGFPYTPMFDYDALNQYFLDASSDIGNMEPTGSVISQWGNLYINAESGDNVFTVDASVLDAASVINISGPADAVVYLNVLVDPLDPTASLTGATPFNYIGVSEHNVIVNFPETTRLDITSGMTVNILAPLADTYFTNGLVTGNLITGDLYGGAQVNHGYFDYTPPEDTNPVPEPGTLILLGSGFAGLLGFRKKLEK